MEPVLIVVAVVFAAVAIAAVYFAHLEARRRREALAALAAELGWTFEPDADRSHDRTFAQFEIFRRGHSRFAFNTLTGRLSVGEREVDARMGDFQYTVTSSNGKSTTSTTYRFSYLIATLPVPRVPDLVIRREGVFDKLLGAIGFDDIDFESEEFSRKFFVKCRDKRFAYDLVSPDMMEFLLATSPPALEIERGAACVSDGRSRWSAEELRARARWMSEFYGRWPRHVVAALTS